MVSTLALPAPLQLGGLRLRPELLPVVDERRAALVRAGPGAAVDYLRAAIAAEAPDDNVYVYDLAVVERLFHAWRAAFPRVHPCYAVT